MSELLPGDLVILTMTRLHRDAGDHPEHIGKHGQRNIEGAEVFTCERNSLATVIYVAEISSGIDDRKVLVISREGCMGWMWNGYMKKVNV